jgi:hypothetical protein
VNLRVYQDALAKLRAKIAKRKKTLAQAYGMPLSVQARCDDALMECFLGGLLGGSIPSPSLCVGGDVFPSLSKF